MGIKARADAPDRTEADRLIESGPGSRRQFHFADPAEHLRQPIHHPGTRGGRQLEGVAGEAQRVIDQSRFRRQVSAGRLNRCGGENR